MNNIFYSILIPVYNVEKYIKECLDSVIRQTYKNFEVIIINDGSTDLSENICKEYEARDNRFHVYNQENQGLLQTRRNSIKKSKGEYILFLDSDDYWEYNLLDYVNREIEKSNCDLLIFRSRRVDEVGKTLRLDLDVFQDKTVFTLENKEILFKEFIKGSRVNSIWGKVVKRDLIDIDADYSQFADKKGEDLLQSMPIIYNARKILYLNQPLYCYRNSTSGRGRNFKPEYFSDFDTVRNIVFLYLKKMNFDNEENMKLFFSYYILTLIRYTKLLIDNSKSKELLVKTINEFKQKDLYLKSSNYLSTSEFSIDDKICYKLIQYNMFGVLLFYAKTLASVKRAMKAILFSHLGVKK